MPWSATRPAASTPGRSREDLRDLVVDQELARSGVARDPRGEIDRPPVDVAVALDDPAGGDPGVTGGQAGRLDVVEE